MHIIFRVRIAFLVSALMTAVGLQAQEIFRLKKLVLAESGAEAMQVNMDPRSPSTLIVAGIPFLSAPDFEVTVTPYIGKPINTALLNDLTRAISEYAKTHDRLVANFDFPTQDIKEGILRLGVLVSRYKDVKVEGNRWFSSSLIEERLGVHPGDEVRISALDEAINWANTNPFRQVKVLVNPVSNEPGRADLIVGVRERFPVRFVGSVDDYGTDILGNRHYTAGIQFGNLWGRDHQASYQFVTTDSLHRYQGHVFEYKIPLPWRHYVELTGSYVRARPTFFQVFAQDAVNTGASVQYTIPLRHDSGPAEWFAKVDFRQSNNNLQFAGVSVRDTKVDTFQFGTGFNLVRRDQRGAWLVGAAIYASPGHLNSRNDTATYNEARLGSSPTYVYGNLTLQRTLDFEKGWQLYTRLASQVSGQNLISDEQLTIGGATTIRGFNTNVFAGDQGFILSSDLQTPVKKTMLSMLGKQMPPLETRLAVFYDGGQVFFKHGYPSDPPMSPMASTGIGVRMSVSNNFSLNFDYGWQITHLPAIYQNQEHGRGHIKAVLAF